MAAIEKSADFRGVEEGRTAGHILGRCRCRGDPSANTFRVQPGAFSVRSQLALGAVLALS